MKGLMRKHLWKSPLKNTGYTTIPSMFSINNEIIFRIIINNMSAFSTQKLHSFLKSIYNEHETLWYENNSVYRSPWHFIVSSITFLTVRWCLERLLELMENFQWSKERMSILIFSYNRAHARCKAFGNSLYYI